MNSPRRLTRSSSDRMIGGVAGGFGRYFGVDIAIARIIWGVLLFAGIGLPLYLISWIAMPREIIDESTFEIHYERRRGGILRTLAKIALLLFVGALFVDQVDSDVTLAAFVLGAGVGLYFLWRNRAQDDGEGFGVTTRRLYRSESNRRILGVFGGLADTIGVDVTLLRILGAIVMIAGFPVIVPLYLLYAIIVPTRRVILL